MNTVLAAIMAKSFKDFVAEIDSGKSAADVAQKALNKHWRVIFNGNSYGHPEQSALTALGVCNIPSTVEALKQYTVEANMNLFKELNIFSESECRARQDVSFDGYIKVCRANIINEFCYVNMTL